MYTGGTPTIGNARRVCAARTSSELLSSLDISPGTVMYYVDPSEGYKRIDVETGRSHAAHVSTGRGRGGHFANFAREIVALLFDGTTFCALFQFLFRLLFYIFRNVTFPMTTPSLYYIHGIRIIFNYFIRTIFGEF